MYFVIKGSIWYSSNRDSNIQRYHSIVLDCDLKKILVELFGSDVADKFLLNFTIAKSWLREPSCLKIVNNCSTHIWRLPTEIFHVSKLSPHQKPSLCCRSCQNYTDQQQREVDCYVHHWNIFCNEIFWGLNEINLCFRW